MLEVWNRWLQLPEARRDPGYAAIEGVVRKFLPASHQEPREKPTAAATNRKKSKKKRKTKRKSTATSASSA